MHQNLRPLALLFVASCTLSEHLVAAKTLSFPSGQPVGVLYVRQSEITTDSLFDDWVELSSAEGEVLIPEGHYVRLDIIGAIAEDLSFLKNLPTDALSALLVRGPADDSQVENLAHLSELEWLYLRNTEITGAGFCKSSKFPQLRFLNYDAHYSDGSGKPAMIAPSRVGPDLTLHGMDDEQLKCLLKSPELEYLSLSMHPISSRSLLVFNRLSKLRVLSIQDMESTGKGFELLRNLRELRFLSVGNYWRGSDVDDLGAAKIAKVSGLKALSLRGSKLTSKGLAELATLPNLEVLNIDDVALETPDLRSLASCTSLKKIEFSSYKEHSWRGLASDLASIRSLESVGQNVFVNREGLEDLLTLPKLKSISVMSDESLNEFHGIGPSFAASKVIESVSTHEILLRDSDVEQICSLPNLKELSLGYSQINGHGLRPLKDSSTLERLYLSCSSEHPIDFSAIPPLPDSLTVFTITAPSLPVDLDWYRRFTSVQLSQISVPVGDEHMTGFAEWKELKSLEISDSEITASGILDLSTLKKLESLIVQGDLAAEDLRPLSLLPRLQLLQVSSSKISDNELLLLEDMFPSARIRLYGRSR